MGTEPTAKVGVLMLDTRFARLPGDVGNRDSWPVPVAFERVPGASVALATARHDRGHELADPFLEALGRLVDRGVELVTTSCGFLVLLQTVLAERSPCPVYTSALLAVPDLLQAGERVGVLTYDARRLTSDHLRAAGAPPDLPVVGLEGGTELHRAITEDLPQFDFDRARYDVVEAATRLVERAPQITTIVYECTNIAPYDVAVREATGRRTAHLIPEVVALLGAVTRP